MLVATLEVPLMIERVAVVLWILIFVANTGDKVPLVTTLILEKVGYCRVHKVI